MGARPRYALIGMPWFWAYIPSIQLAIVADIFDELGIDSETFEFYTDFVEATGINLYKAVANDSGYAGELLFSQFYFEDHRQQFNADRPHLGLANPELEQGLFDFLSPLVEEFLERWCAEVDWSRYDAICFSLTASQTAASMAMAKRVRRLRPDVPILFGGSSCAGEMGRAIARICPEVDIVVHGEAETTLPALAQALRGERAMADVPGISWRVGDRIVTNARAPLHRLARRRGRLDFDSYFKRVVDNKVLQTHGTWVPFESSRGCWYGEKSQCTFCGLNEIIAYRERGPQGLLDELEDYERRYGAKRFFAVDLIMPRSFFSDFLPAVAAGGKDWSIFYEIKSNMNRREIEQLAAGRVTWIQPGIESLDDDVLRLMRKGVSAAQNIQTLKWTRELGILASWNLITGFPREKAASYRGMAELFPKLHHLLPPVGVGDFEVHRFSPYFESPEAHGIELAGAFPSYRTVYPVADDLLDDLVYRHAYRLIDPPDRGANQARQLIADAVAAWRAADKRGAIFCCEPAADGALVLTDTRRSDRPVVTRLDPLAARLFLFLDEMRPEVRLAALFRVHDPDAFAALGGELGLAEMVEAWIDADLVLRKSGYLLALALRGVPPLTLITARSEDDARSSKDVAGARSAGRHVEPDQRAAVGSEAL